jgi:POT family proton-dependent oligopeptide transporter
MLSMNPLLVMILVPIMTLGLYPLLGKLATPLAPDVTGHVPAAASYVVVAMLQSRLEAGAQLSVLWQTAYIILTIASAGVHHGFEFAYREAAPEMKSTITAFFYPSPWL